MEQRLIDADVMRDEWLYESGTFEPNDVLDSIDCQQTVDAVPVVRCRECYYKDEKRIMDEDALWCRRHHMYVTADWFCADGERRTDE